MSDWLLACRTLHGLELQGGSQTVKKAENVDCGIYLGFPILRECDSHTQGAEKRRLQVSHNRGELHALKTGCALR